MPGTAASWACCQGAAVARPVPLRLHTRYSARGCYCIASVNFFGYSKGKNPGVGVGLNNLMKVKDGDRLDGRIDANDDFAEYAETDASGAAAPANDGFLDM